MKSKTAEEILRQAVFNNGIEDWTGVPHKAILEAMEAYRLQGAENLPNDEAIKAICSTDTTTEGIIGAKWMRSEASAIIAKKDEEIIRLEKDLLKYNKFYATKKVKG